MLSLRVHIIDLLPSKFRIAETFLPFQMFVLRQEQLEKHFATEGYKCLSTCVECFDSGKKAATTGTQDMQKKRKEKELRGYWGFHVTFCL